MGPEHNKFWVDTHLPNPICQDLCWFAGGVSPAPGDVGRDKKPPLQHMAVTAAAPGRSLPDFAASREAAREAAPQAPRDEDGRPWRLKEMTLEGDGNMIMDGIWDMKILYSRGILIWDIDINGIYLEVLIFQGHVNGIHGILIRYLIILIPISIGIIFVGYWW